MTKNKEPTLQLQSMIDSHSNPFVLVDEEYNIVAANKAYCDAYGTTDDKVVGCKCHMVSHHFDTPCFMNNEDCPLTKALESNKVYEVLHIHFDQHNQPEHVRIKGHPIMGADGKRYVGEEVIRLAKASELDCEEQKIISRSPAFRDCIEEITRAAESDANVLLTGESGVGKSLAAQYIHEDAKARLVAHNFPGNIRELKNILQRAVSLSTDGHIKAEHIKFERTAATERLTAGKQGQSIKEMEADRISELLVLHKGHRRTVADELGISERTLYRKLEKYNLTEMGKSD